ncbi:MAG: RdgB/HAM1 family non-canonical purine NTP pyrophosphatase [Caldithrix sp.]|nr:RdgB/HAM1 family non-canonical purine NTP pyrophosphatase [Caldithrix sp.]
MPHTLLIATTNADKVTEFRKALADLHYHVQSLSDYTGYPYIDEDGLTFAANAYKKALGYYRHFNKPVIADDSGLQVPALNNAPGIYSARYGGPHATYDDNNRVLLRNMCHLCGDERQARFVCTICYIDEQHIRYFTGQTDGLILDRLTGRHGFGYDPLFYVPSLQKTYAQLTTSEKNRISHRGKAIQRLKTFLQAIS